MSLDAPSRISASSASESIDHGAWSAGSDSARARISGSSDVVFSSPFPSDSAPPSFAAANWESIKPAFDGAKSVNFSTPAENAAANVQPDFILGTDGQLRANPAKTTPSDGNLNIQMEGPTNASEIAAAKMAGQLQKQAAQEMISYFQKNNPGAQIPQHWLNMLNNEPNVPSEIKAPSAPAPVEAPAPQPEAPAAPASRPSYNPGNLRGSLGGSPGGGSPSGGAENFTPSGSYKSPPTADIGGRRVELPPPLQGDLRVDGPSTITAEKIDEVLAGFNSPAQGIGKDLIELGEKYNINPAVALAFFIQESSAGTKGAAVRNNSWGNIKGEGPAGSDGTFRTYNNYKEGAQDWFRLIRDKYLAPQSEGGFGAQTLSQIISKYAPGSDNNNERGYVSTVKGLVHGWAKDSGKDVPASA